MADTDLRELIIITTLIFLLAPSFLIVYITLYNRRKKKHIDEKMQMKRNFEEEIVKTQLEVQEQTMQTIGADLHDNIGQLLSLASLTLNSIEVDDPVKTRKKIDAALDLTGRSIKEMRLLGKLLQGDQLVVVGLCEAIRHEINWIEKSGKYEVKYVFDNVPAGYHEDKDLLIFRIVQEIINNILKHAQATSISIKLELAGTKLHLQIADNGVGFNVSGLLPEQKGMGLQNIHKRAKIVDGEVMVRSTPGKGTTVDVFIPYS